MEEKESNSKSLQNRKGSVKCGLKSKLNTPKGTLASNFKRQNSRSKLHNEDGQTNESEQQNNPPPFKRRGVGTLINRYESVNAENNNQQCEATSPLKKCPAKVVPPSRTTKPHLVPKPSALTSKGHAFKTGGITLNHSKDCEKSERVNENLRVSNKTDFKGVKSGILNFESKSKPSPNTQQTFIKAPKSPRSAALQARANNVSSTVYKMINDSKSTTTTSTSTTTNLLKPVKSSDSSQSPKYKEKSITTTLSPSATPPKVSDRTQSPKLKEKPTGRCNDVVFNKAPQAPYPRKGSEGNNIIPAKPPVLPPRKMSADITLFKDITPKVPPRLGKLTITDYVADGKHCFFVTKSVNSVILSPVMNSLETEFSF